jgi:zinc protease
MKLLVEAHRAVPLVQIGVTFRAGRADDPPSKAGLARVTAEMMRRGGDGRKAVEHTLDRLGADLSEQVGLGATTVGAEALARSAEGATRLMAELFDRPCVDAEELSRVVRQSKAALVRGRDDDSLLVSRAFRRHLFRAHPHGHRVLGTIDGLDSITVDDVVHFRERFYTKENAIVHVCGDVTRAGAERLAALLLAGLPDGVAMPYPATEPTPPRSRCLVLVHKPERSQTQLAIGTLGTRLDDADYDALALANAAFGGMFTSRMNKAIRSERGWSYGASSQLTTGRVREAFTMWTAPAAEDAADCLALELELLREWVERGIDATELEQCRQYIVRSHAFEIDTPTKRLQLQLERAMFGLADDFHDRFLDRIQAVALTEANAAVQRRISPDNLVIACVADADDKRHELELAAAPLAETIIELPDVA